MDSKKKNNKKNSKDMLNISFIPENRDKTTKSFEQLEMIVVVRGANALHSNWY